MKMPRCEENRSEHTGLPHQMKAVFTTATKGPNSGVGQPVNTLISLLPASGLISQQGARVFVIQAVRNDPQIQLLQNSIVEKPVTRVQLGNQYVWPGLRTRNQRKNTLTSEVRCNFCQNCFKSKAALRKHMKIHHADQLFKCPYCLQILYTAAKCQQHVQEHLDSAANHKEEDDGPVSMVVADCQDVPTVNLVANGTKEKSYKCDDCEMTFAQSSCLHLHRLSHNDDDMALYCETCGIPFALESHLEQHRRVHTGDKPYDCQTCGESFAWSSHFLRHNLRCISHTSEEGSPLANGSTALTLVPSVKRRTPVKSKTKRLVPVKTKSVTPVKRKTKIRKPVPIPTCVVGGEQKYSCIMCGGEPEEFFSAKDIFEHINQHLCDKYNGRRRTGPLKCAFCSLLCPGLPGLTRHIAQVHNKVRPYVCHICKHACSRGDDLRKHPNSPHRKRCDQCDAKFVRSKQLDEHREQVHNIPKEDM